MKNENIKKSERKTKSDLIAWLGCPFCGTKPTFREDWSEVKGKDMWVIYCADPSCEMQPETALCEHKKECLTDWNKRAT